MQNNWRPNRRDAHAAWKTHAAKFPVWHRIYTEPGYSMKMPVLSPDRTAGAVMEVSLQAGQVADRTCGALVGVIEYRDFLPLRTLLEGPFIIRRDARERPQHADTELWVPEGVKRCEFPVGDGGIALLMVDAEGYTFAYAGQRPRPPRPPG